MFPVVSLESVRLDHRSKDVKNLLLADRLAVNLVQSIARGDRNDEREFKGIGKEANMNLPLSPVSSSEKHEVLAGSLSDESDLGGPLKVARHDRQKRS